MKAIPHPKLLTQSIRALELTGRHKEAFESLSGIWNDIEAVPNTGGLNKIESAELWLRCGSLAGFLGRTENRLTVQENSKNLLSRARDVFLELGDIEKIVECENGIANAYIRKAEFHEAEVWLESSFARDLLPDNFVRLESFIVRSLSYLGQNEYSKIISFLRSVEVFFRDYDNNFLNGCFSTNLGIAYRNTGKNPEAMQLYTMARHFHKKSGHIIYQATVENNLAYLYKAERRFPLAHRCIERAMDLYDAVGDISRQGFSFDTEADIYFAEGKLEQALKSVDKGLDLLRSTEFTEFLVETLITKVKILIAMEDIAGASLCFAEAAANIRECQGQSRLEALADEFEQLVKKSSYNGLGRILTQRIIPGEELELELSPALSRYTKFEAVWIKNRYLEKAGLKKGCLALVVNEELSHNDIAAVIEDGREDVVCGYFEKDFGLIALTRDDGEPVLFNENEVEVLGKIVGYALPENASEGKLRVEPLPSV